MSVVFSLILAIHVSLAQNIYKQEGISIDNEAELLKVNPEENNFRGEISQSYSHFEKTKVEKEIKVYAMRIERKITYCPASLDLITSEKCLTENEYLYFSPDWSRKIWSNKQCPVTRRCEKGDCDGISLEECRRNSIEGWMKPNSEVTPEPNEAYFFHRCSTGFVCTLVELTAYSMIQNEQSIVLEGNLFKSCSLSLNDTFCSNTDGWNVFLFNKIMAKKSNVDLPCLKGKSEEICWDNEENNDFFTDPDGNGISENSLYKRQADTIIKKENEPLFHQGNANSRDLEAVYRILQFENLQSSYNLILIRKELIKMKRLVSSLILFGFGITTDPLHAYRDIESKILGKNKTHILITARITNQTNYSARPIPLQDFTHMNSLFPIHNFSTAEFKRKKFRIEDYDEQSIFRMFQASKTQVVVDHELDVAWTKSLLDGLHGFFAGVYPFVIWFTILSNLLVLKLILKRVSIKE